MPAQNGHADGQRQAKRILILGAAGRDYHTFNTLFRDGEDPTVQVVGFTHTQIPNIKDRTYPPELCGPHYPEGLPLHDMDDLERLIADERVDECLMAYSDVAYDDVMKLSARVRGAGAAFTMLSNQGKELLRSSKPVVAVTAVRTGCGKSQVCKFIIDLAREAGIKAVLIRHPMPYGELAKQKVQRFGDLDDLKKHDTTIEEREEYEQHIKNGIVVFAGVDYAEILKAAEAEEGVGLIIWDGGNNDAPFIAGQGDKFLWITVADPHRPGHESAYYPGDVNFRSAKILVLNKANTAKKESTEEVMKAAKELNPKAKVFVTASEVLVDKEDAVKGKRVLCVEDGPSITHGGSPTGAAYVAAEKFGAAEIIDPRPHLQGQLKGTFDKFPHIGKVLPAMGYSEDEIKDLEATIAAVPCDTVILGSPTDLTKLLEIKQDVAVVKYQVRDMDKKEGGTGEKLSEVVKKFIDSQCK